ncbi:MAG: radical SAM protein, partial [Candidatus Omnitrophota bacterium]
YNMASIAIMDENFTFYRDHVVSLCKRIIDEKLNMKFFLPNGIRLDTLDKELLLLMRKAGFIPSVAVGIESGSERILKSIHKHLNKEVVKEKVSLMIKCGFRPIGYFILGFPTETKGEMYETLKFAKELKLYRAGFSPLLILPGTDIYKEMKKTGLLPLDYDFTKLSTDNISRVPDGLTLDEFSKIKKDIIWKFNLQPRVLMDYMHDWNSFVFASLKFMEIFLNSKKQPKIKG